MISVLLLNGVEPVYFLKPVKLKPPTSETLKLKERLIFKIKNNSYRLIIQLNIFFNHILGSIF